MMKLVLPLCTCRYVICKDGFKRLQTVRLNDDNLYTPELNTFVASSCPEVPVVGQQSEGEGEGEEEECGISGTGGADVHSQDRWCSGGT